jgi:PAS domain S-box-containing protein
LTAKPGTGTTLEVAKSATDQGFAPNIYQGQLEASVDGVLCVGLDGRILYHNARFIDLWGLSRNGHMGASDEELTHLLTEKLVDPEGYLAKIQSLYEHRDQVSRDEVYLKDGRVFDRYSAPVQDRNHAPIGRVWFFRDISQRKRTEEELRAANDRLRELNTMKNQFVNTAAHELATPITPMALQIHLLLQGQLGTLNDGQRNALELVNRNMTRLNLLMRDILDAADVQSDRVTLRHEPFALEETIRTTLETYGPVAEEAKIKLSVEVQDELWVRGDSQRLTQALRNLLDNAMKFTPAEGQVSVRARREADQIVVHIQDTGIGLRPEDFRKIFQPFSQVHDTMQRTRAGRGLGLVIAQGIVELHGGRMWCDSPGPNRGATFSFSLPYNGAVQAGASGQDANRGGKKSGVWPFIHFRCPVCESRDINMRIIKNKYECMACKHQWR